MTRAPAGRNDAYRLLIELGAGARLLTHLELVGEAATQLIALYRALGLPFDARLVEVGAAIHDAGKIVHPEELDGPGSLHEQAGEELLLAHGVEPRRPLLHHACSLGPPSGSNLTFGTRRKG